MGIRSNRIAALLIGAAIVLGGAYLSFHVLSLHKVSPPPTSLSHHRRGEASLSKDIVVKDLASELLGATTAPPISELATASLASSLAPKIQSAHNSDQASHVQSEVSVLDLKWASPTTAYLTVLLTVSTPDHPHLVDETLHLRIILDHTSQGWQATGVSGG